MNIPINDNAPVTSEGQIEIAARVDAVWGVLTRIDRWPEWQHDVTAANLDGELREGAGFRWKAAGIPFTSRIHTIRDHRLFGWTGRTLGASAIHNWSMASRNDGTTVTVRESLDGPLPRLFRRYFQRNLDAGIQKSLEELKAAAEQA